MAYQLAGVAPRLVALMLMWLSGHAVVNGMPVDHHHELLDISAVSCRGNDLLYKLVSRSSGEFVCLRTIISVPTAVVFILQSCILCSYARNFVCYLVP